MDYLVKEEKKNEDNSFGFGFIIGAAAAVGALIYGFCAANKTTTQVIERVSSSYDVLNIVYDSSDLYKRDFYRRRDEARRRMEREKWFVTSSDIRKFHSRWRKKFYEEGHIGTYHY